jgi:hypothetical protein
MRLATREEILADLLQALRFGDRYAAVHNVYELTGLTWPEAIAFVDEHFYRPAASASPWQQPPRKTLRSYVPPPN